MFVVYLIQSLENDICYVGFTSDIKRRLQEHNAGESEFTKKNKPWKLVYCEAFLDKRDALEREKKLKHHGKGLSELKKRLEHSLHK